MPVLFYMTVYGMIVWPVSIAEVPNICGALICVFLLMGFYYVSLIIGIVQSRNEAEKINASVLMEKYTEGILHEARTVRNHQKLLAIQRHDLRHQYLRTHMRNRYGYVACLSSEEAGHNI